MAEGENIQNVNCPNVDQLGEVSTFDRCNLMSESILLFPHGTTVNTPIKFTSKEVVSKAQLKVYGIPGRDYFGP